MFGDVCHVGSETVFCTRLVDAGFVRVLARFHSHCFANTVFCTTLVDAGFVRVLARSHSLCFANTVFCSRLVHAGFVRVLALSQGHGLVNMAWYCFRTVGNEPGAHRNIAVSSLKNS